MLRWLLCATLLSSSGCVRLLESSAPPSDVPAAADRAARDGPARERLQAGDLPKRDGPTLRDAPVIAIDSARPRDGVTSLPDGLWSYCRAPGNWICTPSGMGCSTTCTPPGQPGPPARAMITCALGMSAICSCSVAGGAPIQCGAATYKFDCPPCVDVVGQNCCKL